MSTQALGKIELQNVKGKLIYCGDRCGRGCTLDEYESAVTAANKLVAALPEGFKPRIWENLGWHHEAVKTVSSDSRISIRDQTHSEGNYSADSRVAGRQFMSFGRTPVEALNQLIGVAWSKITTETAALELLAENTGH